MKKIFKKFSPKIAICFFAILTFVFLTLFVIAQVNTVSIEDVLKRQEELENAMKKEIQENELKLIVLAITDILNSNSEIIALGDNAEEVIEKAFDKKLENNRAFLEGVVSRKKQLLPNIDKNI